MHFLTSQRNILVNQNWDCYSAINLTCLLHKGLPNKTSKTRLLGPVVVGREAGRSQDRPPTWSGITQEPPSYTHAHHWNCFHEWVRAPQSGTMSRVTGPTDPNCSSPRIKRLVLTQVAMKLLGELRELTCSLSKKAIKSYKNNKTMHQQSNSWVKLNFSRL